MAPGSIMISVIVLAFVVIGPLTTSACKERGGRQPGRALRYVRASRAASHPTR